jgi:superfamily II DNA or RNA helicase
MDALKNKGEMAKMHFKSGDIVAFYRICPDIDARTQVISLRHHPLLPDGNYRLEDGFCTNPDCDCRTVYISVIAEKRSKVLATITFGWEPLEFYRRWMRPGKIEDLIQLRGPALMSGAPQTEFSQALLELVAPGLRERSYVSRLKRHYRLFKDALRRNTLAGRSTSQAGTGRCIACARASLANESSGHPEAVSVRTRAGSAGGEKAPVASRPAAGQRADVQAVAESSPAAPAIPAIEAPLIKVNFASDADAAVLNLATEVSASSPSDLFLHRQALGLLLAPGFDTLLSPGVARDIRQLDYQLATVRHVLKNLRGRALLCDEVGLGKTVEAGLVMMEYILRGLARHVLVLTPPSLVSQWRLELQAKFNLDFITYDDPRFRADDNPWATFPYIIASLDTAKREQHREAVLEPVYDLVVVDEAHHLKQQKTLAYQLVSRLKTKYILLLTATPVENDLDELFNLITLLQPGQLETSTSFRRKYITRGDPLKPKNTEELKRLVREVMVRNRRSDTGAITARRRAEVIEVALSPEEAAFYQRLTAFVRGYYTAESTGRSGGVTQFVLKTLQREVGSSIEAVLPTLEKIAVEDPHPVSLRQVCGTLAEQGRRVTARAKAVALVRLLKTIPDKVVVFTCFRATLRFLTGLLQSEGFRIAQLHGGMRRAEKEEQIQAFAGDAQVLVSTETGSEGRNLQFCNCIINYDLPWNPMRIEQRIGRLHRIGQARNVMIYNLSAAGTVEAHILELLDAKINMFQLVVGELDMILGNLHEKRDFEDIIMDIWAGAQDDAVLQTELSDLGDRLFKAKEQYLAVKEVDEKLLGVLLPEQE